jgi:hypothetical protein
MSLNSGLGIVSYNVALSIGVSNLIQFSYARLYASCISDEYSVAFAKCIQNRTTIHMIVVNNFFMFLLLLDKIYFIL